MSNSHLIVGLGGTGGKVIREILKANERNKDAQGNSPSDALFEFVYFDTSSGEVDKSEEWQVLGKSIELDRSQLLTDCKAGAVRPVLDDPGSFPGLKDWIEPRKVFDSVGADTAGAGQKRKLGRLVFAQHASRFSDTVARSLERLASKSGQDGAVIHVVCGLSGGTGSGSVVDAVAQIRERYPEPSRHRILVYAVLPERNTKRATMVAGHANYYANAYAALAELNALAVKAYKPVDVRTGKPLDHEIYFNGCYLVNQVNEHNVYFDIDKEVPGIVAEFIYQKTLNDDWEGLGRAEKAENETRLFEKDGDGRNARSKRFLSFGIKRVVVPEQEIKEFMAYGFAEQVTRQLMFNNFRPGAGFADEAVEKDWRQEARKPDTAQSLLLTDAHLTLDVGILEDDAKNGLWKAPAEFWKNVVTGLIPEIKADKAIEETTWIAVLNTRLANVFDDTYRRSGGVRKFFEDKRKASPEMARHVRRHIERDLFNRWKVGTWSLLQLRHFTDALIDYLNERQSLITDQITKLPAELERCQTNIQELATRFNGVGFLGKHLTDKRGALFDDIARQHQALFVLRTRLEGQKFAVGLIPFLIEQLVALRADIDRFHQTLAAATEQFNQKRAGQLRPEDVATQMRMFDKSAIDEVMKSMVVDERGQTARVQEVRQALINRAGTDLEGFGRLVHGVSLENIIETLSQESARIVEGVHADLEKDKPKVLQVNIVERLQKRYDANASGLKDFTKKLYDEAGCMLTFDAAEVDRMVVGNEGGSTGRKQTVGVFLPDCEGQKEFGARLRDTFGKQQDPGTDTQVLRGRLTNEIVIMKVSSLMPVRFVQTLKELKQHYDGLQAMFDESHLQHSVGNGKSLPPLYAMTADQVQKQGRRKPMLMVAQLLGLIKPEKNKTTGLNEWVFGYLDDGVWEFQPLSGRAWQDVLNGDHPAEVRTLIEREVARRIDSEYRHIEKKQELDANYAQLINQRFEACQRNREDAEFLELKGLRPALREVIGMPAATA